jgi:hypothetical protein
MSTNANRPSSISLLSNNPVVVFVGVAAAAIAILVFVTGVVDLPSVFSAEARLQRSLVGSWQQSSGSVITFYENGIVEEIGGFIPLTGHYRVTDGDRVIIQMTGIFGIAGAQTWRVRVEGHRLHVFNEHSNESFTASRIK